MRGSRLGGWCGGLAASQSLNQTNISWMHLGTDTTKMTPLRSARSPKRTMEVENRDSAQVSKKIAELCKQYVRVKLFTRIVYSEYYSQLLFTCTSTIYMKPGKQ